MTTFLQRNGMDLAIASVIAPLASYGLHRMIPAPDVRFIAVASTLNICVGIALRELPKYITQAKDEGRFENTNTLFVLNGLSNILHTSIFYLLPIFAKYIGQRVGIQAPDYLPMIGYVGLAHGVFWITKHCFEIYKVCYPNPATK